MQSYLSRVSLIFICILALVCPTVSFGAEPKVIRVGIPENSITYYLTDDRSAPTGYEYDYLQELGTYMNWNYEYVFASQAECLRLLQAGKIDLVASLPKTPETEAICSFSSESLGTRYTYLYTDTNDTTYYYDDTESFDNMIVGTIYNMSTSNAFKKYVEEHNFSVTLRYFSSQRLLIEALDNGTIDAAICNQLGLPSSAKIIAKFAPSPNYFAFRLDNTALATAFNQGQAQFSALDPSYNYTLLQQYFASDNQIPALTKQEATYVNENPGLRVALVTHDAPYSYYDEKESAFLGLQPAFLDYISEQTDLSFSYVAATDSLHAQQMLADGEVDLIGSHPHNLSQAQNRNFLLTHKYVSIPVVLVRIPGDVSAQYRRVAYVPSATSTSLDMELSHATKTISYDTAKDCLDAILSGDADVCYLDANTATALLMSPQYKELVATSLDNVTIDICFATQDTNSNLLITILNKAITHTPATQINQFLFDASEDTSSLSFGDMIQRLSTGTAIIILSILLLIIVVLLILLRASIRSKKEVHQAISTDSLTHLPSNATFIEESKNLISANPNKKYAILQINIERFKYINETYGYEEGDDLLLATADMLRNITKEGELATRTFADNFTLLLTYENLDSLYDRLNESEIIKDSGFHLRPAGYHIVLSSGMYLMKPIDDPENFAAYIVHAHYAKDTAKGSYRNTLITYTENLRTNIQQEKEIENIMQAALESGQFVPYFQAKTNIITKEVVGAEALVRWFDPAIGMRSPGEFIPFFEKCGFIIKVDMYIFDRVCAQIAAWRKEGLQVPPISTNFSRLHTRNPNFVEDIVEIAKKHNVPPELLELEITETISMDVSGVFPEFIKRLHKLGFKIAIDDFGTGYSSLTVLDQFEIDVLKLDRQFFIGVLNSPARLAIISRLVEMAHDLDIQVVCEGIETDEQEKILMQTKCYVAQGFKYARPIAAEEFVNLLK